MSDLVKQFRDYQAALGHGCYDGYCVIEKTKGQHTNGGCNCLKDLTFMDQRYVGHMLRTAQTMADRIEALEAENARLREALSAMLNHSCVADAGADMKDAEDHQAERLARAALSQKKEQGNE